MRNFMKTAIPFIISILIAFNCLSQNCVQIYEGSLRTSEFYDNYNQNSSLEFDSVIIYDYKYNKKGKIQDSIVIAKATLKLKSYEPDNYVFTYDTLNREFQRFEIKDGLKILNSEKQYNSKGNLILWTWFTREGKIHSKTFYEYDSEDNLLLTNKYTGYWYLDKPKLEDRVEYKYSNNKLIETKKFYDQKSDSSWFEVWTTKYDSLGRQIFYKDDGGEYYWYCTFIYDNNGLLGKEIIEGNAREKSIKEYSYNESRLPSQLNWYYPDRVKNNKIRLTRYYYK
jgi:hypothetical protein